MLINKAIQFGIKSLKQAKVPSYFLDTQILLSHALKKDKKFLILNPEKKISAASLKKFKSYISRRKKREPVAYIRGFKEFWSLDFIVNKNCLIPRPETEILIESVKAVVQKERDPSTSPTRVGFARDDRVREGLLGKNAEKAFPLFCHPERSPDVTVGAKSRDPLNILEIGTGCGNIAIIIAKEFPESKIIATDASKKSLEIAIKNARKNKVKNKIKFISGNLFAPFARYKNYFDIIVSNPPYACTGDIKKLQKDIKFYEPLSAIDGGKDGLDFVKKIIEQSKKYLKTNGVLLIEIAHNQAATLKKLYKSRFDVIKIKKDYAGLNRVIIFKNG